MKKELIEQYPAEIQKQIISKLGSYNQCHVEQYNGKYYVCASHMLATTHAKDYKCNEEIRARDLFTTAERVENYKKAFGYAPCEWDVPGYDYDSKKSNVIRPFDR